MISALTWLPRGVVDPVTAPEDDLTEEQLAELQDEAPQEPDGMESESESSEDENTTMLDEAQQIAQAKAAAANLKSQQDGSTGRCCGCCCGAQALGLSPGVPIPHSAIWPH